MEKIPISKYRCQRCKCYFEIEQPRQVTCPACGYNYIDWENAKEVLEFIWNNVPYYKEHGYSKLGS
jgi:Zn finger protein HypA/HybF involved in hydrogenase expression